MDSQIQNYSQQHTSPEPQFLRDLRENAERTLPGSSMLSGHLQGRFLAFISKLINPKYVLDIGTYAGYSALCLAEGLQKDGKVITIDNDIRVNDFAKVYFEKSEYKDQIDLKVGNAIDIIPTLNNTFDLVFIDADKSNYANYYNMIFPKLRKGGVIIADNVLWHGKVLDAGAGKEVEKNTKALNDFNKMIQNDQRVSNLLLPIRDGLMVIQKKKDPQ